MNCDVLRHSSLFILTLRLVFLPQLTAVSAALAA